MSLLKKMSGEILKKKIIALLLTPLFLLAVNLFLIFQFNLFFSWQERSLLAEKAWSFSPGFVLSSQQTVLSFEQEKEADIWQSTVIVNDARPLTIKNYLEHYRSPLAPYYLLIFEESLRVGLNPYLVVAIAQQESNLCKKSPPNCFNCWGIGIHSRGTLCFESYEQGIKKAIGYLKEEYLDQGLTTPEEIMAKYCPLSEGSWAAGVNQFLEELEKGFGSS